MDWSSVRVCVTGGAGFLEDLDLLLSLSEDDLSFSDRDLDLDSDSGRDLVSEEDL